MNVWRDIPGYDGYQASDNGRIRSVDRMIVDSLGRVRQLRGRELTQFVDSQGYFRVGRDAPLLVHRLICLAFNGKPPSSVWHAAHRNGDNQNNSPENLYWATASENQLDRVRHGRNQNSKKTHCPRGHKYSAENTFSDPRHRRCRACHRQANARWRSNQKKVAS